VFRLFALLDTLPEIGDGLPVLPGYLICIGDLVCPWGLGPYHLLTVGKLRRKPTCRWQRLSHLSEGCSPHEETGESPIAIRPSLPASMWRSSNEKTTVPFWNSSVMGGHRRSETPLSASNTSFSWYFGVRL